MDKQKVKSYSTAVLIIALISILAGIALNDIVNSWLGVVLGIVTVVLGIMIVGSLPDVFQGRGWLVTAIGLWLICVKFDMLSGAEYKFNAVLSGILLGLLGYSVYILSLKEERKSAV
jgi:hypothetical protein